MKTIGYLLAILYSSILILCNGLKQPSLENQLPMHVDYDAYKFESSDGNQLQTGHVSGVFPSTNRTYSGWYATFAAKSFSFYPPTTQGCLNLLKVSDSSLSYSCEYATNGAFFYSDLSKTGSLCVGNLISDGKTWQLPQDGTENRTVLGVTAANTVELGFMDRDEISKKEFTQLISGWGWIVRNGVSNVNYSQDLSYQPGGFTWEKAPRTAVGVFSNGTMLLLEVDGIEDLDIGPDLYEMAELLVLLGVESAVNIDGGGSSVSVYDDQVVSEPHCKDTTLVCERSVASIACVRK